MPRNQHLSLIFLSLLTLLALVLIGVVINTTRHTSVVIEWSTASELDTVGFNIYRGETIQESGIKVNAEMIPASADALIGSDYQFVDTTVQTGRTYYYWLEDVDAAGVTGRNGPIEARASSNLLLNWLLILALLIILAWGWFSFLRPRRSSPAIEQAQP